MSTPAKSGNNAVSLLSALVIQGVVDEFIVPAYTDATKIKLIVKFDPTSILMTRIKSGERGDVIVAIDRNIDELIEAGIVSERGRVPLVRTGVGVAVRAGAPKPDISTVSGFTQSLLNARSVAYSRTGASGIYFAALIEKLGIADEINSRSTIIDKGLIAEALLTGTADIAVQQLSELATVAGVDVVGPLPAEIQHTTDFSVALFCTALDNQAAIKLVSLLVSEDAQREYRRFGLEIF
ncbi:substrate-binding domain-containing protein [Caballeronia sp. 15715]|uniref:substrate-binding domain-containing protein n=1 Tax=unclassified Caballeronia TaxID=2646786 RepID=UPI0039E6DDA0